MPVRTFTMNLTPNGRSSNIKLDGADISMLLTGVVVRSSVDDATSVELQPGRGHRAQLVAALPEAHVVIAREDDTPDGYSVKLSELLLRHDARHVSSCPQGMQNYWRLRPEYRPSLYGPDLPCTCGLDALIGKLDDRRQG